MEELSHNATFRILPKDSGKTMFEAGIYRVILDEVVEGVTVVVLIQPEDPPSEGMRGGRKKKQITKVKRKKPRAPLVGDLSWLNRAMLLDLFEQGDAVAISIERENLPTLSDKDIALHEVRCRAMSDFLDYEKLRESILMHHGVGGLVHAATKMAGVGRSLIYVQWSNICRYGFSEKSLWPRHDRCGAPRVARPCDPNGRKKAGRRTTKQRVARAHGVELPPEQPGVSTEWTIKVLAADKRIGTPKPSWPERCLQIIKSAYCAKAKEVNGKLELVAPEIGTYPNNRQIRRIVERETSRLERLLQTTTEAHFTRAMRGMVARNWKGVAGPGHTWAIDSTVGDIRLRSSIDRTWIVGRPIVYVIVDVWSTAVVGFYVCLEGPKWDTAKIALFNSSADPALVADLWGYELVETLTPRPTLCYALLCDRGEYLSQGHRLTAIHLFPLTSYAMPYRADLKGLVEVLHRITKDQQFHFVRGALDFRRAELEFKRVNPADCTMTVREYVHYLHQLFSFYNLTADRTHRLDAHMIAAGVIPSPAGLWRWGHLTGIGFRQNILESDLISTLLPCDQATVGRSSVRFARCDYMSRTVQDSQWTAIARNFGGWTIPINHYPGSMSRIWTPNSASGQGLLRLDLTDESRVSEEVTLAEWEDALAVQAIRNPDIAHSRLVEGLKRLQKMGEIASTSEKLTAAALARAAGAATPTMSEARAAETNLGTQASSEADRSSPSATRDQMTERFDNEMDEVLRLLRADAKR